MKVGLPDADLTHQAGVLAAARGRGYAVLHDHDPARNALLIAGARSVAGGDRDAGRGQAARLRRHPARGLGAAAADRNRARDRPGLGRGAEPAGAGPGPAAWVSTAGSSPRPLAYAGELHRGPRARRRRPRPRRPAPRTCCVASPPAAGGPAGRWSPGRLPGAEPACDLGVAVRDFERAAAAPGEQHGPRPPDGCCGAGASCSAEPTAPDAEPRSGGGRTWSGSPTGLYAPPGAPRVGRAVPGRGGAAAGVRAVPGVSWGCPRPRSAPRRRRRLPDGAAEGAGPRRAGLLAARRAGELPAPGAAAPG